MKSKPDNSPTRAGRHLSISLVGHGKATSFACRPNLNMRAPGSGGRYFSICEKTGQNNPWPYQVKFKPPKLVPYANLEPGGGAVLRVEEDGELVLKRRLALAYLDGVKMLPPEFIFSDRDDSFFSEHSIEGADIMGFWLVDFQRHGKAKWTSWELELPEGEYFEPGKLEIPVFRGYTNEEPHPDLDAEFFCDPKRIRYGGRLPGAQAMKFSSDPEFDGEVETIMEY